MRERQTEKRDVGDHYHFADVGKVGRVVLCRPAKTTKRERERDRERESKIRNKKTRDS